jgi:hypothetical protein
MIYLLFIPLLAIVYLLLKPETQTNPPKIEGTWKRDLTAHEVEYYKELRKHWRRQARITYKKLNSK